MGQGQLRPSRPTSTRRTVRRNRNRRTDSLSGFLGRKGFNPDIAEEKGSTDHESKEKGGEGLMEEKGKEGKRERERERETERASSGSKSTTGERESASRPQPYF